MTTSTSLIEMILNLLRDPDARAAFLADSDGYLSSCGLQDLSSDDIHDALVLLQDNDTADFSRDYNTGGNSVAVATPAPVHHGGHDHDDAVRYLNTYITNNYVDDRDTITDNSINQQIDTGGGDFDQDIDIDSVVASGDGAVAAGDDIEDSTIVTGDENVVGDNNQAVTGDGNTTSFGSGDATSTDVGGDVNVGSGGGFASGSGTVVVDNTDNSQENVGNDNSDNSQENVGNTDVTLTDVGNTENETEVDNSLENVGNDYSQNELDVEIDNSLTDSGNTTF